MAKTANGTIPVADDILKRIDPTTDDYQHFYEFAFVDDSEEWYGVIDDIYPDDVWVVKINIGYVTDSFTDYGVVLEKDNNDVLFQGAHDADGISEAFVWDGATILGGNSPPGNIDLVLQQVDSTDAGVNYSAHVTAYRVKKDPRSDEATPPHGTGTIENFD